MDETFAMSKRYVRYSGLKTKEGLHLLKAPEDLNTKGSQDIHLNGYINAGDTVLIIGAGTSRLAEELHYAFAENGQAKLKIVNIDYSEKVVEAMKKRHPVS